MQLCQSDRLFQVFETVQSGSALRAFELHEEHGLHVHLVTNSWIDVNEARVMAQKAGWGRIHVKRIPAAKAGYLGKYLSKEHRAPCFKGWRLWAAFGVWDRTKTKDVEFTSDFARCLRQIIASKNDPSSYFTHLCRADRVYLKSIRGS